VRMAHRAPGAAAFARNAMVVVAPEHIHDVPVAIIALPGKSVTVWQFMQRGSLNTPAIFRKAASERARASGPAGTASPAAPTCADQTATAANHEAPRTAAMFEEAKQRIVEVRIGYIETPGSAISKAGGNARPGLAGIPPRCPGARRGKDSPARRF
jgi:hypothetical protein